MNETLKKYNSDLIDVYKSESIDVESGFRKVIRYNNEEGFFVEDRENDKRTVLGNELRVVIVSATKVASSKEENGEKQSVWSSPATNDDSLVFNRLNKDMPPMTYIKLVENIVKSTGKKAGRSRVLYVVSERSILDGEENPEIFEINLSGYSLFPKDKDGFFDLVDRVGADKVHSCITKLTVKPNEYNGQQYSYIACEYVSDVQESNIATVAELAKELREERDRTQNYLKQKLGESPQAETNVEDVKPEFPRDLPFNNEAKKDTNEKKDVQYPDVNPGDIPF